VNPTDIPDARASYDLVPAPVWIALSVLIVAGLIVYLRWKLPGDGSGGTL